MGVAMVDATVVGTRHNWNPMEASKLTQVKFANVRFTLELDEPPPTFRSNVKHRKGGGRYNDAKYNAFRERIRIETKSRLPDILLDGLVILRCHFSFPLPKRVNGVRAQYKKDRGPGGVPHIVRPDLSNMVKLVEDSLEGVFYRNDGQIATSISSKAYHDRYLKGNTDWFETDVVPDGDRWYVSVDCEGIGEWRKRNDDSE